jgi:hypothetical protein
MNVLKANTLKAYEMAISGKAEDSRTIFTYLHRRAYYEMGKSKKAQDQKCECYLVFHPAVKNPRIYYGRAAVPFACFRFHAHARGTGNAKEGILHYGGIHALAAVT